MTQPTRSRWSWHVATVSGIAVRVHVTLVALLVWIAIAAPIAGAGLRQTLAQSALVVAIFACIAVHELAHALVARRFGCSTREILLLPIGGIAQMERLPQRPVQELLVAVVGPATNLVIAALLGGVMSLAGWPIDAEQPGVTAALVVSLFWSNIVLAAFNLLPAFPMDGGRVLRALLATRMDRARATRIAGTVGKLLSVVFVLAGLAGGGVMLVLVGAFVWIAATQESATVQLAAALSSATVADAMIRPAPTIDADIPIDVAVEQMLARGQRELVVEDHGRVAGIVTAVDLAERMTAAPHGFVGDAAQLDVPIVAPSLSLDAVLEPLARRGVVLVGNLNQIIGMLSAEQLATYASLHPQAQPMHGARS